MKEVVLDTETTGLSVKEGHKIVEIGCIELDDLVPTANKFHCYLNPERKVSKEALQVHGYTDQFLLDKKKFNEIADEFLKFIKDKKLIIHNADFDLAHLNHELQLIGKNKIKKENVIDTLDLAREKFPGAAINLDALCKRYRIDNSKREKHSALVDCHLLKEVYVNLLDQKEPKLDLENSNITDAKHNYEFKKNNDISRKIIRPSKEELKLHQKFLKSQLTKNNYS